MATGQHTAGSKRNPGSAQRNSEAKEPIDKWIVVTGAFLGTCLVSGLLMLALGASAEISLVVAALAALACAKYAADAYTEYMKSKWLEEWKWSDVNITENWVSDKTFDMLRSLLDLREQRDANGNKYVEFENQVDVVTRYRWYGSLKHMYIPGLITLAALLLTVGTGSAVFFVIMLAGAFGMWYGHLSWRYSFVMVTNLNIWIIKKPPWWLPWMRGHHPTMPRKKLQTADPEDTFWGKQFHHGRLRLDGAGQHDEAFNNMNLLPRHEEIVRFIRRGM